MSNRIKVMILILLFWTVIQISLLAAGFPPLPVLGFVLIGSTIFNLIGLMLDLFNHRVGRWFDKKKFKSR